MHRTTTPDDAQLRGTPRVVAAVLTASALILGALVATPITAQADEFDTVSGSVLGEDGAVLADAALTITNTATAEQAFPFTDDNGGFAYTGLDDGDYELRVVSYGYTEESIPFEIEGNDVEIDVVLDLAPRYTASGRVVSASDISGLVATLTKADTGVVISTSAVDAAGNYSLPGTVDGYVYIVTITDPLGDYDTTEYVDSDGSDFVVVDVTRYGTGDRTGLDIALDTTIFTEAIPTITGSVLLGGVLTANAGTWTPVAAFTYQWFRTGIPIAGATGSTYAVTAADQGASLSVVVTGMKRSVVTITTTAGPLAIPEAVDDAPAELKTIKTSTPKITGTAKVGKTLKVVAKWKPSPKLSYQWYANGKVIKKATSAKLKLTKALAGKKITVKVTGKKNGHKTVIKKTKATPKVKKK
jgi:hypothetical protein